MPFEIYNNQIALRVSVNGSSPLTFALDTGSSACVVDINDARALKLELEGNGLASGEGQGIQAVRFARDVNLGISGLRVQVSRLAVMKLRPMGRKYSGLLGYDFFARYVVEVDYD
ncbi:MAG: aspartyl protease family protein, partial [Blastocatellia bacterium]